MGDQADEACESSDRGKQSNKGRKRHKEWEVGDFSEVYDQNQHIIGCKHAKCNKSFTRHDGPFMRKHRLVVVNFVTCIF